MGVGGKCHRRRRTTASETPGNPCPHPARPPRHHGPWRDPSLAPETRVDALIAAMTLEEKVAQLYGVWVGAAADGGEVAPHQHDMEEPVDLDELLPTASAS